MRLFLFAGEASGDVLGANLMHSLKQIAPSFHLSGVGGPHMRAANLALFKEMEPFQVMGFSEVLKALPYLYREFQALKRHITQTKPDGVVFIDYPEFSMRLAKALRKAGYRGKLIQYVCPSVWAWRKRRIYDLARTLDLLLSTLPFEKDYFSHTSLPVTYVGHPLLSHLDRYTYDPAWKEKVGISKERILSLFPGSRLHEIQLNLPLQLQAAEKFIKENPSYRIAISVAHANLRDPIQKMISLPSFLVPPHFRYELMQATTLSLATSGTVILELALHKVPTVVTYRLSGLNYLLGRYLFRILLPFYTLPNILCNREIYPEFIHKKIEAQQVYHSLKELMEKKEVCRNQCSELRHVLLDQDASRVAALSIESLLKS